MNKKILVLILQLIVSILAITSWVYLFFFDWKLAIAILFVMAGNNIATRLGKKQ